MKWEGVDNMDMFNNVFALAFWFAAILGLGALGGYFSEKGGVVNIAINGLMIFGTLMYAIMKRYVGVENGWMQLPMIIIVGLATSIFGMLHGFASIHLKANQTISGTAINMLAAGIALFTIMVIYKSGSQGMESSWKDVAASQSVLDWKYAISLPVGLAIVIFAIAFAFMKFTKLGTRIKAAGDNPQALESQGISVVRIRYIAVGISGFLAGISGAIFAQKMGHISGNVQGLGFVALAILIAGQWSIPLIGLASIVFAVLNALGNTTVLDRPQFFVDNSNLLMALPFVLSLVTLVFTSRNSNVPKAAGIPYDKSKR